MKCPNCESEAVSRSHRAGRREQLVSCLGVFPFYCEHCKARFFRFKFDQRGRREGARGWDLKFYAAGIGLFLLVLYFLTHDQ